MNMHSMWKGVVSMMLVPVFLCSLVVGEGLVVGNIDLVGYPIGLVHCPPWIPPQYCS